MGKENMLVYFKEMENIIQNNKLYIYFHGELHKLSFY